MGPKGVRTCDLYREGQAPQPAELAHVCGLYGGTALLKPFSALGAVGWGADPIPRRGGPGRRGRGPFLEILSLGVYL